MFQVEIPNIGTVHTIHSCSYHQWCKFNDLKFFNLSHVEQTANTSKYHAWVRENEKNVKLKKTSIIAKDPFEFLISDNNDLSAKLQSTLDKRVYDTLVSTISSNLRISKLYLSDTIEVGKFEFSHNTYLGTVTSSESNCGLLYYDNIESLYYFLKGLPESVQKKFFEQYMRIIYRKESKNMLFFHHTSNQIVAHIANYFSSNSKVSYETPFENYNSENYQYHFCVNIGLL